MLIINPATHYIVLMYVVVAALLIGATYKITSQGSPIAPLRWKLNAL